MDLFLIISIVIILICVTNGSKKGVARILYGIVAWIFVFWAVNFGTPYVFDYLSYNTNITESINTKITEQLVEKYKESELEEEGSGKESLMKIVPKAAKEDYDGLMKESIDLFISKVAEAFTEFALRGIATVLAIILAFTITWIVGQLIFAFELIPGINDINSMLGGIVGIVEGVFIIWIIMTVADSFPTSFVSSIVHTSIERIEIMDLIYQNNLIKALII